jgi:hypothetical protein
MPLPFAAGQRVFASDLNSATQQGPWTTGFVPLWTQTGQTPSFGNAVVTTGYAHTGRVVTGRYQFTFGSTTNFGSGTNPWNFTLPVAPVVPASNFWNIGSWSALCGGTFFTGAIRVEATGALGFFVNNSTQSVNTTNPGTWVSGNYLQLNFQYESTS